MFDALAVLALSTTLFSAQIAEATWGPAPCGQPVIVRAALPARAAGMADMKACTITVSTRPGGWGRELFCTIVVHEWGHHVKRQHSQNPRSVMYRFLGRAFPACRAIDGQGVPQPLVALEPPEPNANGPPRATRLRLHEAHE